MSTPIVTLDDLHPGMDVGLVANYTQWVCKEYSCIVVNQRETPAIRCLVSPERTTYCFTDNVELPDVLRPRAGLEDGKVVNIFGRQFKIDERLIWKVGDDWRTVHSNANELGVKTTGDEWSMRKVFFDGINMEILFIGYRIGYMTWYLNPQPGRP